MKTGYTFPWRNQNSFKLLVDSHIFYPPMLEAIRQAQHFIFLEQYLVSSGNVLSNFIQALINSAQRGIKVFILFDDYGSKTVKPADKNRLAHKNISFVSYNPFRWTKLYSSLRRNHRKLLLVDNNIAFVGGAGLTDGYQTVDSNIHSNGSMYWHDIMLEIKGQVVADWYQSFTQVWNKCSSIPLPKPKIKNPCILLQKTCIKNKDTKLFF